MYLLFIILLLLLILMKKENMSNLPGPNHYVDNKFLLNYKINGN